MINDERLFELLDNYSDQLARGGEVTPADLGVDLETFARLVTLHRRLQAVEGRLSPVWMPDLQPGVTTDRYRTNRILGSGGNGDVFRTEDHELSRSVALKVPRVHHTAAEEVNARLWAEAMLMGQLDHPGVPAVHSLGTDRTGRPFYTMRLIDGTTLADEITRLHLSLPTKLSFREFGDRLRPLLRRFVAVCAAVAYAHSRGVLHRDLKPHNVMLGAFDETLVMDWGLARVVQPSTDGENAIRHELIPAGLTAGAIGTIGYISPEQWLADPTIDYRADVYSLGAILYHLLAGRASLLPTEIGEGLRPDKVRPLREVKTGLPPALVAICEKAMSADRAGRYSSAVELSADVQAWLDDRPVRAYREPWVGRVARWTRRHRTPVSIAATALPLLVALGIGGWMASGIVEKASAERTKAMADKESAEQASEEALARQKKAEANVQSAEELAYSARISAVEGYIRSGDIAEANRMLAVEKQRIESLGSTVGFEWGYLHAQIKGITATAFTPFHGRNIVALCQPDGAADLVSVSQDGSIIHWDRHSRTVRSIHPLDFGQTSLMSGFSFQPFENGYRVATLIPGFPVTRLQPPLEVGDRLLSVGPDDKNLTSLEGKSLEEVGKLISAIQKANISYEFAKPDGTQKRNVTVTRTRNFQQFKVARPGVIAFSRDGSRVAIGLRKDKHGQVLAERFNPTRVAGSSPAVMVFDSASGDIVCTLDLPSKAETLQLSGVSFSPDGTELIVGLFSLGGLNAGSLPFGYVVYDTRTGKRKTTLGWPDEMPITNGIAGIAYDPTGRRIYSLESGGAENSSLNYWPVDKLKERPTDLLRGLPVKKNLFSRLEVSPDGRHVVIFGFGGAVIAATGLGNTRRLDELRGDVTAAAFDPSGRLLAVSDSEYRLHVWEVFTMKPVLTVKLPERTDALALTFSADSRQLFVGQGMEIFQYSLERQESEVHFQSLDRRTNWRPHSTRWAN